MSKNNVSDFPAFVGLDRRVALALIFRLSGNTGSSIQSEEGLAQVELPSGWSLAMILAAAMVGAIAPAPVLAQITPDDTLGSESSQVIPDTTIRGLPADLIEGGATRGSNLFHSFVEFNVNGGQRVYFANPIGIENILSRVTGLSGSDINGLLGVNGGANLFLLNPNGIVFGPNASLDVNGSFTASTADSFLFPDGSEFSATSPGDSSLLSISLTPGVQFGSGQGDVTNAGNLAVNSGQGITLHGGTVISNGALTAPGGTVQVLGDLVALTESARVDVSSEDGGGTVLVGGDYRGEGELPNASRTYVGPDVTINADALSDGDGGAVVIWADEATGFYGNISARGGNLTGDGGFVEISGLESLIFAGAVDTAANYGDMGQLLLDPANITIANTPPPGFTTVDQDDTVLADFFYSKDENIGQNSHLAPSTIVALLSINNLTLEAAGTIAVTNNVEASSVNDLTLSASKIEVSALLRQSGGGNIFLESPQSEGNSVVVDEGNINTSVLSENPIPQGGDVRIKTHDLFIKNDAIVAASTASNGNAGQVVIETTGDVTVDSANSFLSSQVNTGATGNSGGISINTRNLAVLNGAEVSASTFSDGDAGQVKITATGDITVDGADSFIVSRVNSDAIGDSSGIFITAQNLSVLNAAVVSASTFGDGDAGQVKITATGDITVDGADSFIASQVNSDSIGDSGGVSITTQNLSVLDGAAVAASTFSEGNAGKVEIKATGFITVNGEDSVIASQVKDGAIADSGGVSITTQNLSVLDGAAVSASTFSDGNAGKVEITATGDITVDGADSFIASQVNSDAIGDSGGVAISTKNLSVLNGAAVSTSTFGDGNSGQVEIMATDVLTLDGTNSLISSQVNSRAIGDSGGISITTKDLSVSNGARVTASAFGEGEVGNLTIRTNNVSLTHGALMAESNTGTGGNITLQALSPTQETFLLLMRDNSVISAKATDDAIGGNVYINDNTLFDSDNNIIRGNTLSPVGFVLADQSNNDILASAVGDRGGNIRINAFAIFGLEERDELTDFSDINASSELGLDGEIILNTLNIDPTRGLGELPIDIVDASSLVAEGCIGSNREGVDSQGEFTRTGRGGLSPDPTGVLTDDLLFDPGITPEDANQSHSPALDSSSPIAQPLVEAQGLAHNVRGQVSLVAGSANLTSAASTPDAYPCDEP